MSCSRRFVVPAVLLLAMIAGCQPKKCGMRYTPEGQAAPTPLSVAASPLAQSRQLLLVVAADWNTDQARLQRFAREADGHWHPVGDDVAVTIGKNGLAWGRGLHGAALGPGPVKVEGDGRAPAGVFTLSTAFAYNPAELWKPTKMPMHQVTDRTICVETITSKSYNRMLDEDDASPHDWVDPDRMLRPDGLYRYGLFVDHNYSDTKAGAGSCIFMHLWRRPGSPTVGCTAMNDPSMQVLLSWLDPADKPVLVQLPKAELVRLAPAWGAAELTLPPHRNE